jgi:hypothetical protein
MNGGGKSDRPIVPKKPSNKDGRQKAQGYGGPYTGTKAETPDTANATPTVMSPKTAPTAEEVEGRGLAKGNLIEQTKRRTQSRESLPNALDRVRLATEAYGERHRSLGT